MTKKKVKIVKKVSKGTKKSKKLNLNGGSVHKKNSTLTILSAIKPGLAIKAIVESMKNFYFDGKNIVTYNDKISIMHPFKTEFKAFIHADTFYKLISKLPSDKFTMQQITKDQVNIKTINGVNVTLPTITDEKIINRISVVNKGIKNVTWEKLPKNFTDCINLCSFAASTSETESTISCIRLESKICVATDSKRLAYAKLNSKIKPMFIKASEVKHLLGIKPTHYGSNKGWLFFKNDKKCVFSIRKIEGEFPKWKHLFKFDGSQVKLPTDLLSGIDLASIFIENDSSTPLKIEVKNNTCTLSVKTDGGKLTYPLPVEYNKEPINFSINPDFLKEMVKFDTTITFVEGKAKLETESFAVLTALFAQDEDEGERYTRYNKKD